MTNTQSLFPLEEKSYEGIWRNRKHRSTDSLNSALDGGEWSASLPGRRTPGERSSGTHWIRRWLDPRAGLDVSLKKKLSSRCRGSELRFLGYPASSVVTTPTTLSRLWSLSRTRLSLKCDGTRAETRFRLSAKRTSPFKSAGASVQSTTGRRAVHISLQCLYSSCKPVFCSHVTLTAYPLHSLVSPLLLPWVTVCHHISTGLYDKPPPEELTTNTTTYVDNM